MNVSSRVILGLFSAWLLSLNFYGVLLDFWILPLSPPSFLQTLQCSMIRLQLFPSNWNCLHLTLSSKYLFIFPNWSFYFPKSTTFEFSNLLKFMLQTLITLVDFIFLTFICQFSIATLRARCSCVSQTCRLHSWAGFTVLSICISGTWSTIPKPTLIKALSPKSVFCIKVYF